METIIKEYFRDADITHDNQGYWIIKTQMPEAYWVYRMVLSYGDQVEVLEPESLKNQIIEITQSILTIYK